MQRTYKVRVPWYEPLPVVREVLRVYDGVSQELITSLIRTLHELRGTPQSQVDWKDPDQWISERLSGDLAALARRFWEESGHRANPRYLSGPDYLIKVYALSVPDVRGTHRHTELGRAFVNDEPYAIRQVDEGEGVVKILAILSTKSPAKLRDLYDDWAAFVREHSKFKADASVRGALRERLRDLRDRGLITREGQVYTITPNGLDYCGSGPDPDPAQEAVRAIKAFNDRQQEVLRERLMEMHPYRFEHLVSELLEAMGYDDVDVTKQSGDKGVDVVGTVQFGITTVTEVVQVKRHQGSIGRPVLDQLRGALVYHEAIRGTIITTGRFSEECKKAALHPGAAPISLIDGDRLLDLLIEHRIGVESRPATLFEVDEAYFAAPTDPDAVDEADADE